VRLRVATDTYTSVLLDLHFTTAEATARLVLAAAAHNPSRRANTKARPGKSAAERQATRPEPLRPKGCRRHRQGKKGRTTVTPRRHPKIKTV